MQKKKPKQERTDADRRVRQCERLARLMKLLYLISGRGRWDAAALAEELDCSKRTVHRFLQTLSMAGVPWYFDERIRAYKLRPGYKFPILEVESSSEPVEVKSSEELTIAAKQLLNDGEVFSESLDQFLKLVGRLVSQES